MRAADGLSERARGVWAATRLRVWPERYRLASLPRERLQDATALAATAGEGFVGLVLERDEVSLAIAEELWQASPLRDHARASAFPYRILTLDIDIDLSVTGYLAPAAVRLADAGVSIVPVCAYLKDHLMVREADLAKAMAVIEGLIAECRSVSSS